jgi:thiol-disulfide isomerase/thioredoxin
MQLKSMKKRVLTALISCILVLFAYLGYQSYKKIETKKAFTQQVKRLPKSTNFRWIGKQVPNNDEPTIILFFNPDCDHCQYEAKAILEHQADFTSTNFWWVATVDGSAINNFSKKYSLGSLPNHYFAKLPAEKIVESFGSVSVPHIFIYDKTGVLQKEFRGETKIEALLKYTNSN